MISSIFQTSRRVLFLLLLPAAMAASLSCGPSPDSTAEKKQAGRADVNAGQENMEDAMVRVLQLAKTEPEAFERFCRLLMEKSLFLALDTGEADETGDRTRIRVKTLNIPERSVENAVLVFTSQDSFRRAASRLNWTRNDEGAWPFASVNGRELFESLQNNGFSDVLVNFTSPSPFVLDHHDIRALAQGEVPPFRKRF